MRAILRAVASVLLTALPGCSDSPAPGAVIASEWHNPQQCSDVLNRELPMPVSFEPGTAVEIGKLLHLKPDQVAVTLNRLSALDDAAERNACQDRRCGTIVSMADGIAFNPADQKPFVVTCRNQDGVETRFSYPLADLESKAVRRHP